MKYVNCTPHVVNILGNDGEEILAVPPLEDGQIRVTVARQTVEMVDEVEFSAQVLGDLETGLGYDIVPKHAYAFQERTCVLVSLLVLQHPDLPKDSKYLQFASPGEMVRNSDGVILGTKGLNMRDPNA